MDDIKSRALFLFQSGQLEKGCEKVREEESWVDVGIAAVVACVVWFGRVLGAQTLPRAPRTLETHI